MPYYDESYRTTYGANSYPYHNPPPHHQTHFVEPRRQYPNQINLKANQKPRQTVEEALYILGKNILGRNVTDRLFPAAKILAEGVGQVGQGFSTIGQLLPPLPTVDFDGSALKLLPNHAHEGQSANQNGLLTTGGRGQRNTDQSGASVRDEGGRITTPPRCTTPKGGSGRCMDIQNCPLLLADLKMLRRSVRI